MYGEFDGLQGPYSLELDYEPYQSYEVGVWVDENGGWYLGTDSTCSCYTPFENYSRDDLTGPMTASEAVSEIKELWGHAGGYSSSRDESWLTDFIESTFHVRKIEKFEN